MDSPNPPTPLGLVERLLAAAAVAGAAIFVLLNALYIEFLDDFGLRPEDVGIDRLAVLGRAAWIALFGLGLVAIAAAITTYTSARRLRIKSRSVDSAIGGGGETHHEGANDDENAQGPHPEIHKAIKPYTFRTYYAFGAVAVAVVGLLVGFLVLRVQVERSADAAKDGERVGGLGWLVEFVDIRALPARITWVSDQPKPSFMTDRDYLYLGRGERVVAVLTCEGRTIMFRADDVIVQVLEYNSNTSAPDSIC